MSEISYQEARARLYAEINPAPYYAGHEMGIKDERKKILAMIQGRIDAVGEIPDQGLMETTIVSTLKLIADEIRQELHWPKDDEEQDGGNSDD